MKYNFDHSPERRNTDSQKWDGIQEFWGRTDLTPMWIADMDFQTPSFIIDRLRKKLEQGVLGYTRPCTDWSSSIISWLQRKHGWQVTTDMISFIPGIVRGLAYGIGCFSRPGDRIMVMSPVYPPFFLVSQSCNREVVYHRLKNEHERYEIDFERFAQDVRHCKILILCNPHNPGGRVWSKEELMRIAHICKESGTLVLSDEIHADLTYPCCKHHPFSTVSAEAAENSIVFMSPSKAFNVAGLSSSYAVMQHPEIRQRFQAYLASGEFSSGHMFAYCVVPAAYSPEGEEWLKQVLEYVQGNVDFLEHFLAERIPQIKAMRPQASFLAFLNCQALQFTPEQLSHFFADKAHLALNSGASFGPGGEGYMRLNLGCPRSLLKESLEQLEAAVKTL